VKLDKKNLVTAITFLLIGIIVTSVVWVYASPSTTFTISGGIYPQASYTEWREGSNYYAKDAYGRIVYEGTNVTTVFNNAFANGGTHLIKSGTYIGNFKGASNLILEGEGIYKTILRSPTGIILDFYDVAGHFSVKNLQLDGVSRNTSGGVGLRLGCSGGVNQMPAGYFQNLRIGNVETGISFAGAHSDSFFEQVTIGYTKTGISYQGLHNTFTQTTIDHSSIAGCSPLKRIITVSKTLFRLVST